MFKAIPNKFNYTMKRVFGKDIKVLTNTCNRVGMSCGGGGCGGGGTRSCNSSLFLHTNSYCNANCHFCISDHKQTEIKDFAKLEKVIAELVNEQVVSKVCLTGGEPLMHPRFVDFLSMLDNFDLESYSLNTNGTLLHNYIDEINKSNLAHVNISLHHYEDSVNKRIMGRCLTFDDVTALRKKLSDNIEMRMACTITADCHTEKDIMAYTAKVMACGVKNVIFRNEYNGFDQHLAAFKKIWKDMWSADICNCGYKMVNGIHTEYRESNIALKQAICEANTYFRDFIYKDDDKLGGSWEYGSQIIY